MEADDASPHVNTAPYPVTDGDGYYMAYKDGDTWVNWWAKPKWGLLGVLSQFLFTKVSKEIVIFCGTIWSEFTQPLTIFEQPCTR